MKGGHGGRTYLTHAHIARIFYTCLYAQKQAPVAALYYEKYKYYYLGNVGK